MPKRRNDAGQAMLGVNLFHAARSNCSARVRLLLSEKSLSWISHLISLQKRENRTPEYFAINPKGLVPTLMHDGWIITESNDILRYLEEVFPEPGFQPSSTNERAEMSNWMQRSAELHLPGVKTLNYSRRRSGASTKHGDGLDRYRALQADPELLRFHDRADSDGFSFEEESSAEKLINVALGTMNGRLSNQQWLSGDSYSLADICWAPTIPTV